MLQNYRQAGRANWLFSYTAAQVAWGARQQKEYRDKRLKIWKAKREEVMAEIRSKGLTVTDSAMESLMDSMAGAYATSNAKAFRPNNGPTIQVNDQLREKLAECYAKVNEHETLSNQYDVWIQTLEAQPSVEVELNHEDFKFFFLNVGPIPTSGASVPDTPSPTPAPTPSPAPIPTPSRATKFRAEPKTPTPVEGPTLAPNVQLVPVETPQLRPSTPTLQQRAEGGSLSSLPAFSTPITTPVGPTSPALIPANPAAVKTVFVPPDFEDDLDPTPSATGTNPFDNWPSD